MRKIKINIVLLLFSCIIFSCTTKKENSINGLWVVDKVQIGENSMTPVARWTKFNSDSTLTSGNGWLQHSIGTWSLEGEKLTIRNENGVIDESEPFAISIDKDVMTWKRNEEGEEVIAYLKRAKQIPTSGGNKLMGLWKLVTSIDDGNDITIVSNPSDNAMMHLRWDNMYVQHNMPNGKQYGIYKIHGHKPEIQLVNYGEDPKFSFWNFSFDKNVLRLTSNQGKSIMEFIRIHQFLE